MEEASMKPVEQVGDAIGVSGLPYCPGRRDSNSLLIR
jgi:hypothetical protein